MSAQLPLLRPAPALLLGLCALVAGAPAVAESFGSSAASSVSSAGSAASGSVSDSLKASSGSSGGQARVAQGAYRVLAVQAVADRPGVVELRLRPERPLALAATAPGTGSTEGSGQAQLVDQLAKQDDSHAQRAAEAQALASGAQDLWLRLPRSAMGPVALDTGDRVWAQVHGYGVAFARGEQRADSPFYLVLHDNRRHDLASRVLSL